MTTHWMCAMGLQQRQGRSCGSPRESDRRDSSSESEPRPDPPRAPSCREWIAFLSSWHRIVHAAGFWRLRSVPPSPPMIWEFCERYDLPVPRWAILNAELHGWRHLEPLIERLAARHANLARLSAYARRQVSEMDSLLRRMEHDRYFASTGCIQTKPGCWEWPVRLLS
jgi:hypothetical protein